MIAGRIFKVRVEDAGGIVGLMRCAGVVNDKKFVLGEHAFDVIAVLGVAHDDGDEVEMILLGGVCQFGGFVGGDIVGKHDPVVAARCGARKTRDHAINFLGLIH